MLALVDLMQCVVLTNARNEPAADYRFVFLTITFKILSCQGAYIYVDGDAKYIPIYYSVYLGVCFGALYFLNMYFG